VVSYVSIGDEITPAQARQLGLVLQRAADKADELAALTPGA
jgi:hypothetical protein